MTRADRLAEAVEAERLDLLLVADLVRPGDSNREAGADVFWLTGFTGTSSICLVGPHQRLFLTDFRYTERAEREVEGSFDREILEGRMLAELAKRLHGRVGFDESSTSVQSLRKLSGAVGDDVELVATDELVGGLRRTKDPQEVERIAVAAALADEAYEWICGEGLAGRTERAVQLALEQRMRELGAQDPAFPTIVASGPNGSLPHHEASEREIERDELVTIDMGAIVDGYCSDCTRTFATGELSEDEHSVYELVRSAQAAALDAVGPGVSGKAVDSVSRDPIVAAGHGDHYGHGLGHGVGIEVHEPPRLSQRYDDQLAAGDVVTVEPGVYVPGRFGVRIEDLVAILDDGVRNLSSVGKELRLVA